MNYNLLWKKQDRYRKKNNIEHHILLLQNVDQLATVRISLTLSAVCVGYLTSYLETRIALRSSPQSYINND